MRSKAYEAWQLKMKQTGIKKRVPVCGQFELTPRCNFDCKMCYVHNQNSNSLKSRELTTEQWKRIFDEAYDAGMMFATLTGGECLLREDFRELYLHLWNKRVMVTVLTNGYLINDDYVAFFEKYQPDLIQITLYGSSEDGYRNVTGHTGFAKVMGNLKKLRDAGINLTVTVTPSKYGADDYIDTIQVVRDNGFNLELAEMILLSKRDDPVSTEHNLSLDEIVDLSIKRMELYCDVIPVAETPKPCGNCTEAPCGLTCNAGNGLACVIWDGTMYPCGNAMAGEGASLLQMSYAEAWEKTKAATDSVVLPAECVGCPYEEVCSTCPPMRALDMDSGHCNPAICEMTRRLVAAGVKKLNLPEKTDE